MQDIRLLCGRIIEGGLIFLIIFTPLAFGTVHVWAYTLMELTVFILLLIWFLKTLVKSHQSPVTSLKHSRPKTKDSRVNGPASRLSTHASSIQNPKSKIQNLASRLATQDSRLVFARTPLNLPLILFLGLILFQMVPLPPSALKLLSPNTYNLYKQTLMGWPNGQHARFTMPDPQSTIHNPQSTIHNPPYALRPLSIYPHSTKTELLKFFTYSAVFFLIVNNVSTRSQVRRLVLAIIIAGSAVAFLGILQMASGTDKIYWFWQSQYKTGNYFGPYVNPNHFAGYLGMIIPLGIGLLLSRPSPVRSHQSTSWRYRLSTLDSWLETNPLLIFVIVIMASSLFLSLSRGGILSFLFSLVFFLTILGLRKSQRKKRKVVLVILGLVFVFLIRIGVDPVLKELSTLSNLPEAAPYRSEIWKDTLNLAGDFPVFGIGLSNFQHLYSKYNTLRSQFFWHHAHNDYLEILSETGCFGLLFFFGGVIFLLIKIVKKWRARKDPFVLGITMGGIAGVMAILFHSLVEFNLHVPANAMLLFVMLGITVVTVHLKIKGGKEYSLLPSRTYNLKPKMKILLYPLTIVLFLGLSSTVVRGYLGTRYFQHSQSLNNPTNSTNPMNSTNSTNPKNSMNLHTAIALDPSNAKYHFHLAETYTRMLRESWKEGNWKLEQEKWIFIPSLQTLDHGLKALDSYKRALSLQPTRSHHHLSLAWHYGTLAQLSTFSRQNLNRASCIMYPESGIPYPQSRIPYPQSAQRHFKAAISLSPTSSYAHRLYALWAFNQLSVNNPQTATRKPQLQALDSRLMTLAVQQSRRAIELDPSFTAEALKRCSNFTRDYEQLKKILPPTPDAVYTLAVFLQDHDAWDQNVQSFRKDMESAEDKSGYYKALARGYYNCKDYQRAIATLHEYLKVDPHDAETHFTLADWAFYGPGDRDLAFKEVRIALKLDPENTYYRYWYCRWLGYTHDYENAIAECEKILQIDSGHKKAKEWLEECKKTQTQRAQ